jgi:hypothetical protein
VEKLRIVVDIRERLIGTRNRPSVMTTA